MATPRRAAPLAPAERRARIIASTLPLLRRYGKDVTTAQIAVAAGVAEGTLFRAFPDKEAIIAAVLEKAFESDTTLRELEMIDRALPLREKLILGVDIMADRVAQIWELMAMLNVKIDVTQRRPPREGPPAISNARIGAALLALFAGHESELRCAPEFAMRALRMFAFASTHPRIADGDVLASAEIVSIILDGVLVREDEDEC